MTVYSSNPMLGAKVMYVIIYCIVVAYIYIYA